MTIHKTKNRKYELDTAFLFLLPGLVGFIIFYIWPFLYSIKYAFVDKAINGSFNGLTNLFELLNNKSYMLGLKNTIYFILICVPLNIFLALSIAMLINMLKKYKEIFSLLFLIPLVIPSSSIVFFWKSLFAIDGFLNSVLFSLGIKEINWLDSDIARWVIILIFIWKNLGYNIILFLAGLSNIPKEYYEAAQVDGAKKTQLFFKITCVYLTPTFFLVIIMSIINSFKVFKEIYLIMDSNHPHKSVYMLQHFMNNMFETLNYTKLTSATLILIFILLLVIQFLFALERKIDL